MSWFRLTTLLAIFVLTLPVNANADGLVVDAGVEYGPHLRGADLVDDRVNRDRCLTSLSVTDDQLALPSTNRDH